MLRKVFDFVWSKMKLRLRTLKIKPLYSPLTIAEWFAQFVVKLLYRDMLENWSISQIENWVKKLNADEIEKRHIRYMLLKTKKELRNR